MGTDDRMTIDERRKYLRKMQKRYHKAKRAERSQLLDEICTVSELHRKSVLRLLATDLRRRPRRQQRGRTYGRACEATVRVVAESVDYICAERLQPNLIWLAEHLVAHDELRLSPKVHAQLQKMSVSTLRRMLQRLGTDRARLPRKRPERTNRVARQLPAGRIAWDEREPGHFEVDLVHHCGVAAAGHYVHTLQIVDVATGWSERVAMLGRSYLVMQDGFRRILARLPFVVREIHSDNGSEFLNNHLLRFWQQRDTPVQLSRSRPYRKNDNRFVEQKNATLVRAYLGEQRLDTVVHTHALNRLYQLMGSYYNLFQPVMRLTAKTHDPASRTFKRRHDRARTPFDRLCDTPALSQQHRQQLQALRRQINPRHLRRAIYQLLDDLFALPPAQGGHTQDVYLTLSTVKSLKGDPSPVTLSFDRIIPPG